MPPEVDEDQLEADAERDRERCVECGAMLATCETGAWANGPGHDVDCPTRLLGAATAPGLLVSGLPIATVPQGGAWPGPRPGLLLRVGADPSGELARTWTGAPGWALVVSGGAWPAVECLPVSGLRVRLHERAARQHVAHWLAERLWPAPTDPYVAAAIVPGRHHHHVGPVWGVSTVGVLLGERWRRLPEAAAELLRDLDPGTDNGRPPLPDGSRWVEAEVCRRLLEACAWCAAEAPLPAAWMGP